MWLVEDRDLRFPLPFAWGDASVSTGPFRIETGLGLGLTFRPSIASSSVLRTVEAETSIGLRVSVIECARQTKKKRIKNNERECSLECIEYMYAWREREREKETTSVL